MILAEEFLGLFTGKKTVFIDALVTSVDTDKGLCRCKVINTGQTLTNVRWLTPVGETPGTPTHGEQVTIARSSTGYIIIGSSSLNSSIRVNTTSILDGLFDGTVNRNITASAVGYNNVTTAIDHVPGDNVLSARGGSFIGALVGGVALLKASPLAQILASKIEGFVKIFALNFQRFTEAASYEERNRGGRVSTKREVFTSQDEARSNSPRIREVLGDVQSVLSTADTTEVYRFEVVEEETVLLEEVKRKDGSRTDATTNLSGDSVAKVSRDNSNWEVSVIGPDGASMIHVDQLTISSGTGDSSLILNKDGTISLAGVLLQVSASTAVNITSPTSTFNGNVVINGSTAFNGTSTSSGTLTFTGSGDVVLASGVSLGSHTHDDTHGGQVGPPKPG